MSLIKYANDKCVVLQLDGEIYFLNLLKTPRVYNKDLILIEVRNVNYWLETKTGYSFDQIKMMANSFVDGIRCSYSLSDVKLISSIMIKATEDAIFKTDFVKDYSSVYWVELMDLDHLNRFIMLLRNNFAYLKNKYGEEQLYNILCRFWQFCSTNYPDKMHVFESIIKNKLDKTPILPKYPDTSEIGESIRKMVFGIVFNDNYNEHKHVSDDLLDSTQKIIDNEQF